MTTYTITKFPSQGTNGEKTAIMGRHTHHGDNSSKRGPLVEQKLPGRNKRGRPCLLWTWFTPGIIMMGAAGREEAQNTHPGNSK